MGAAGAGTSAGAGTDIAWAPGQVPGWNPGKWEIESGPAPAKAFFPGTEPPGWNQGGFQLMGCGASTCAAMPPGVSVGEQLMPAVYTPPPPGHKAPRLSDMRQASINAGIYFTEHDNGNGTVTVIGPGGIPWGNGGGGYDALWMHINFVPGEDMEAAARLRRRGNIPHQYSSEEAALGRYERDLYGFNGLGGVMSAYLHQAGAWDSVSAAGRYFYAGVAFVVGDPTHAGSYGGGNYGPALAVNGLLFLVCPEEGFAAEEAERIIGREFVTALEGAGIGEAERIIGNEVIAGVEREIGTHSVYQIEIFGYKYIGRTGRAFEERLLEHSREFVRRLEEVGITGYTPKQIRDLWHPEILYRDLTFHQSVGVEDYLIREVGLDNLLNKKYGIDPLNRPEYFAQWNSWARNFLGK